MEVKIGRAGTEGSDGYVVVPPPAVELEGKLKGIRKIFIGSRILTSYPNFCCPYKHTIGRVRTRF